MTNSKCVLITEPAPGTIVKPIHVYDDEHQTKLKALQEYTSSLLLPSTDSYHPWEKRWLSKPDTHPRYLRAAKWKLEDAKKRILGTLEWRREFKPELIPPDEVKIEAESGKIILNGFDVDGRPIIYMRPGRENTPTSPRQLRHLVWVLERAKDMMPPGQESLMIIVDYRSTTLRTNPSISVASKVLTILQHHYVETLGRAIVVNLPLLLSFFYKGIAPFLDPVTRDKMRFNPDLFELVPRAQLDADFGGDYVFEWDFEAYWAQVVRHCGIAPDGTRVEKESEAEAAPASKTATAESDTATPELEPAAASSDDSSEEEDPDKLADAAQAMTLVDPISA